MYPTRTLIVLAAGAPDAHAGPYIAALRARPDVADALAWLLRSDASDALKDAARAVVRGALWIVAAMLAGVTP